VADFDDIDALLSDSLKKAAEPANSAGVADAIRSRVAAGDAGASVAGTTAPGWKVPQPSWFWPLLGTVIGLAGVLAVLVAVLIVPPAPVPTVTESASPTPTPAPTSTPTPTPTPTPTETSVDVPPPPPRDTVSPRISAGKWTSAEVYSQGSSCTPVTADIVVTAMDETQLADVSAMTNVAGTAADFVGFSGMDYTFRFSGTVQSDTDVTVTFIATDDAGNTGLTSRQILLHPFCQIIG